MAANSGLLKETLTVESFKRVFYVHAPQNYNPRIATPVVLLLHGEDSNAEEMCKLAQFDELSDKYGFLVVYPQGVKGRWNDGRRKDFHQYDDVGYVAEILNTLERKWHADSRAVFVAGFSDGGFFAQYLALKLPGKVTALASVSATMSQVAYHKLRLKGALSVLYLLGMDDPLVPWSGGPINPASKGQHDGLAVSASEAVSFWVRNIKCNSEFESHDLLDTDQTDNTTVKVARYCNCPNGNEVIIYGIQGGGHSWPQSQRKAQEDEKQGQTCRDVDAREVIFAFFSRHGLCKPLSN